VIFYTTTRYAVFRYFEEYEGDVCDVSRSNCMYWLSSEEEKKLCDFEIQKMEKFDEYIPCSLIQNDKWI